MMGTGEDSRCASVKLSQSIPARKMTSGLAKAPDSRMYGFAFRHGLLASHLDLSVGKIDLRHMLLTVQNMIEVVPDLKMSTTECFKISVK